MPNKINLVVAGCTGRMGRMILEILPRYESFNLIGLVEKIGHTDLGKKYSKVNIHSNYELEILDMNSVVFTGADVLIDFTLPDSTIRLLEQTKNMGLGHVIGTTGFSVSQEAEISKYSEKKVIVKAGNMSLGVNLLAKLAEMIASTLDDEFDIEILEMHHREKIDAPSGTAIMLGEAAAKGRKASLDNVKELDRNNLMQSRKSGTIGFSSLRGGDVVGEHSVIFAGFGERITVNHIANNREIFARGALKAASWAMDKDRGLYSMMDVLGL